MKKLTSFLLAILVVLSLCACTSDGVGSRLSDNASPPAGGLQFLRSNGKPGASAEKMFYLGMHGDLPSGTYRLVVDGLSAVFPLQPHSNPIF